MKLRILKWLFPLLAVALTACEKDEKSEPKPVYEMLGTYTQAERTFDILQAYCVPGENFYEFLFSADAPIAGTKVSSYCMLSLNSRFIGQEFAPENYVHNSDYTFVYEDPIYYYSQIRPVSGKILVVDKGENQYQVSIKVKLFDGSDFTLELDHVLPVEGL